MLDRLVLPTTAPARLGDLDADHRGGAVHGPRADSSEPRSLMLTDVSEI